MRCRIDVLLFIIFDIVLVIFLFPCWFIRIILLFVTFYVHKIRFNYNVIR